MKVLHCLLRIHKPLQPLNVCRIQIPGCGFDTVLLYPENRLLDRFFLLSRSRQLFDSRIEKCCPRAVLLFLQILVHPRGDFLQTADAALGLAAAAQLVVFTVEQAQSRRDAVVYQR